MQKRSVVIAGRHNTSITLEPEFMEELKTIAAAEHKTVNELVTEIDAACPGHNLSSAIRVYILQYLKKKIC